MHGHADRSADSTIRRRTIVLGFVSFLAFLVLSAVSLLLVPAPKLLFIAWVAFVTMSAGAVLGARTRNRHPLGVVWTYGLASGAMVTSSAVFLVPSAIGHDPSWGGFGIAAGVLTGFGAHAVGHRISHRNLPLDRTAAQLSAHSLSAGAIIGLVYTSMPSLGALLGLSIVSHKGPAGYAAARRFTRADRPLTTILLPATGVGIAALTVSLFEPPASAPLRGIVFGFAAGTFLHVAMDFLPSCETGGEVHTEAVAMSGESHELLDRLRLHAVASTFLGGFVVFLGWVAV
ncbi:putative divalent heavy-metal cations transporter [Halanaeroarchaeum sp. HSR-CO]|uniref:ZIP family metal transporter n=1 Tax=Halanaeroarchaeum sp. HSR-CO TaxID=2866382 RepID=UPI00217CFAF1|nr:ZIP family metal transporter [Halanaeroarchaeum sp. HSR-CO]UWG48689.1 putative divalent heavy-metal cations transporter [Halanaeroarchaeum sp. HSR-CO]